MYVWYFCSELRICDPRLRRWYAWRLLLHGGRFEGIVAFYVFVFVLLSTLSLYLFQFVFTEGTKLLHHFSCICQPNWLVGILLIQITLTQLTNDTNGTSQLNADLFANQLTWSLYFAYWETDFANISWYLGFFVWYWVGNQENGFQRDMGLRKKSSVVDGQQFLCAGPWWPVATLVSGEPLNT